MTGRASEAVGRVREVAGRVCEAAGSASKAAGWASQTAGRYYQNHAFENRVDIMNLHSTVNRPLGSVYSGMENHDINAVFKSMFLVVPPSCL